MTSRYNERWDWKIVKVFEKKIVLYINFFNAISVGKTAERNIWGFFAAVKIMFECLQAAKQKFKMIEV